MRELKFRVWAKGQKKMFAQGFTLNPDGNVAQTWGIYERQLAVMQFTGLKDKNGKEIYEGDIVLVRLWQRTPEPNYYWMKHTVEWHGSSCRFVISEPGSSGAWGFDNTTPMEVIGNIYENPELLKS